MCYNEKRERSRLLERREKDWSGERRKTRYGQKTDCGRGEEERRYTKKYEGRYWSGQCPCNCGDVQQVDCKLSVLDQSASMSLVTYTRTTKYRAGGAQWHPSQTLRFVLSKSFSTSIVRGVRTVLVSMTSLHSACNFALHASFRDCVRSPEFHKVVWPFKVLETLCLTLLQKEVENHFIIPE